MHSGTGQSAWPPRRLMSVFAAVAFLVLVLTASSQIYDANFLYVWAAASMIEGDALYRDFFDSGWPLAAYVSMAGQRLAGYRLIGEFAIHWMFIVAGVVIAFSLGLRLTRSLTAIVVTFGAAMLVLAYTPTYHYNKLFLFPLTIWLAWRYIDRPGPWRAAALGAAAGVAFLFRHDFAMYTGFACVLAVALARWVIPASRSLHGFVTDGIAGVVAVVACLTPWALIVQTREGLGEFFQMRTGLYLMLQGSLWDAIWRNLNPLARIALLIEKPPSTTDLAVLMVQEIALLVPVCLLVSAGWRLWRHRRDLATVAPEVWHLLLAGAFLLFASLMLFRQPSYVVVVGPLTAAFGARFLAAGSALVRGVAAVLLLAAAVATVIWAQESPIFRPAELPKYVARAARQLFASPPIPAESSGAPSPLLQYLRDCSSKNDRLLITGSTPFQVNYYARRRIAGGHLFWHFGWRSDPVHEEQSLKMIAAASVPFAVSTTDPLLDDFARYPRIRAYLIENYAEIAGTRGRLLVDTRRQPTGTFEPLGYPCFR